MKNTLHLRWDDYEKELQKKPGFKRAMQEAALEYQVARAVVMARVKKRMTQKELATSMGTKQSVISRFESGKTIPSLSFLKRLADALNASLQVQFDPH